MTHSTYEALLNYLENRLSSDERSQVDAHLAVCLQCSKRLSRIQVVLQSVAKDRTVAPSAEILKRAVELSHASPKSAEHTPWMRVIAALRFDSRLQFSAAATRGIARNRQMLFTTQQVDIDLQVRSGSTDNDLIGQVLPTQSSESVISAFVSLNNSAGTVLRATETDSLGRFTFRQLAFGTYDLVFDLGDQEVAIAGLELRHD